MRVARVIKHYEGTRRCAVAYERGTDAEHGHLQAVIEVDGTSAAAASKWVQRILAGLRGLHVRCVSLTQNGMHTFKGMLGYVCKDAGQPHFRLVIQGVTSTELLEGLGEYALYGECCLKKRKELGHTNWMERAFHWVIARCGGFTDSRFSVSATLTAMIRSGKYYPSAAWSLVRWGGAAMVDRAKAETIWRMVAAPADTRQEDVNRVFFSKPTYDDRYFDDSAGWEDGADDLCLAEHNPLERLMPYLPQDAFGTDGIPGTILVALLPTRIRLLRATCGICKGGVGFELKNMNNVSASTARTGACPSCMNKCQLAPGRFAASMQYVVVCPRCTDDVTFWPSEFKVVVLERNCLCNSCWDDALEVRKVRAERKVRRESDVVVNEGASGSVPRVGQKRGVAYECSEVVIPGSAAPPEPPSKRRVPTITLVTSSDEEWDAEAAAAVDAVEARQAASALIEAEAEEGEAEDASELLDE
ncbi:hypothetical protein HYH02_008987 [Chlamydomonas schloesseri]|uniref:Replitron HUH endonuclease domain-containing protein n=1 Tax=Chlamydomonas schloesseri TaxID=2026947 RepID=A0A835WD02_9CHLO|nr:hypothetical protein HYH02_008987 [Chlamydomonas schloesseri]|eukprot:KAG2445121.1 hypothetical protein HYH02_008987 [Chlamydomonas schloesseri]